MYIKDVWLYKRGRKELLFVVTGSDTRLFEWERDVQHV
jgi:hypothetical protein